MQLYYFKTELRVNAEVVRQVFRELPVAEVKL